MTLTAGRSLFDAVKECNLREVLEQRGYAFKAGRDNFFAENPIRPDDRTSSIRVIPDNPARYFDFGSNEGGDLIDFLQAAEGMTLEQAREEAAELLGVTYHSSGLERVTLNGSDVSPLTNVKAESEGGRPPGATSQKVHTGKSRAEGPPAPANYDALVEAAHQALLTGTSSAAQEARDYLKQRGLDPHTEGYSAVRAARVGVIDNTVTLPANMQRHTFAGRLIFPYFDGTGSAVFLNARAPANVDQASRFRKPAGAKQEILFNHQAALGSEKLVITEGELDALSILQATGGSVPAVATGGAGIVRPEALQDLTRHADALLLAFDNDDAGLEAIATTRAALGAFAGITRTLTMPEGSNDPNAALLEHGPEVLAGIITAEVQSALEEGAAAFSDTAYLRTQYLEELDRRHSRPFAAYSTGLEPVDALLEGGYSEGLHIIGGITGGGKTSFAVALAARSALEGRPVIYATYEQSKYELWGRLAAHITRFPYGALKRGTYREVNGDALPAAEALQNNKKWSDLLKASEALKVIEAGDALARRTSTATVEYLQSLAERLKRDYGVPPLVIVDYLQRVPAPELQGRDIRERVSHVAGLFQVGLAREVGCPVIALSSLNRESYSKNGVTASLESRLSALKEAGEIEYSAYTVALLSRIPEGSEPANMVPGPADNWRPIMFDLVKHREGGTGETPVMWTPPGDTWAALKGQGKGGFKW